MFKLLTVKDEVRVLPKNFDMKTEDAIRESLKEQVEGKLNPDIGVFLTVTKIIETGEGEILPNDPAIHYPATYEVLVFEPEDQEIIDGIVIDITEFGAFVRIGPMDGLVHISQIMDERISYDSKHSSFMGRRTKKKLQEEDIVRVRIVGVSLGKARTKISLTMRQPCLGSLKWVEADKKKTKAKKK